MNQLLLPMCRSLFGLDRIFLWLTGWKYEVICYHFVIRGKRWSVENCLLESGPVSRHTAAQCGEGRLITMIEIKKIKNN